MAHVGTGHRASRVAEETIDIMARPPRQGLITALGNFEDYVREHGRTDKFRMALTAIEALRGCLEEACDVPGPPGKRHRSSAENSLTRSFQKKLQ